MVRPTDPCEPGLEAIEQAAAWHAQLADEACNEADRNAFRAWIDSDPGNRIAYERMTAVAGRIAAQGSVGATALSTLMSPRRGSAAVAVLMLGIAATLGWYSSHHPAVRSRIADQRTALAELRTRITPAGDRVTLDGDSAVDLDDDARTVRLWRGGVMVDVRRGLPQSFVVLTPEGSARALGTRFDVRREGDATVVTVIESRVEACSVREDRPCLTLDPGQSAGIDATGVHRRPDVVPASAAAWSDGFLVADDEPLPQVLDRLNRYRDSPIRYDAASLRNLRVSGTFPSTDAERALASIAKALPVTIGRASGGIVVEHRRGN